MNRPWQDYADFGIQLLFWALFIYGGFAAIDKFKISAIGQLFFWPVGAFVWWWLVIQALEPIKRKKEKDTALSGSVTVYLKLQGGEYGSDSEREKIRELTDHLDEVLNKNSVGHYDGDEYGNGECVLFMYTDDPEKLLPVIKPLLLASDFAKGSIIEIDGVVDGELKRKVTL